MWKYLPKVFGGANLIIFFSVWILTSQQLTTNLLNHPCGTSFECNLARSFLVFSFFCKNHFISINTHTLTAQDGELSWMQDPHKCRYDKRHREDFRWKVTLCSVCLVLLSFIAATEGAELLSGPILLNHMFGGLFFFPSSSTALLQAR